MPKTMKVHVDPEICAGFGICLGIDPDAFELTDDGYAIVTKTEFSDEEKDLMRRAADQCPSRAITLEE